jgi:predicted DNA-binding transcriptional regulator AlpA
VSATYLYRGRAGWVPGADAPVPPDPSRLTVRDVSELAGVTWKVAYGWTQKPGFPRPLPETVRVPRAKTPAACWPAEEVRAWLRGRNLLRDI